MKSYIACAALLLPLLLSGCVHKQKALNQPVLAPPIEDTPPPKPDKAPIDLPPAVITVPSPPQPKVTPPPSQAQQKPRPAHHKPKPATQPAEQGATQEAVNTPPSSPVSAAGSFSTGEPADMRKQTDDTISETEKGLNGITRNLNDSEKKTSSQIREFLKQARSALTTGDVDGAHTLALKAKVLLSELTQ